MGKEVQQALRLSQRLHLEVSNPPDHPGLPGVGDGGGGIDVGDPLRDPPAHQRTCASSWCLPVSLWNNQDVRI